MLENDCPLCFIISKLYDFTGVIIMSSSYIVKDINLAGFGKKEILIAETEMPGLVATVDELGEQKPLSGAKIAGCPI